MVKMAASAGAKSSGLRVGDKAPDFRLRSDEGKEVSLRDFIGKRVVLYFFPKANTPG
jgi:thioredoxin-dependent peroxiredoxin